jgi:ribosomal protein L37AE/L43A
MGAGTEYLCEACGKIVTVLNETDDYIWVCNDCFRLYNEGLTDPDCMIESE